MNFKTIILTLVINLFFLTGFSQICILNIGSENTDQIKQIFQLNETQNSALQDFKIELNKEITNLEAEVKTLLETHPQSNPEELLVLAKKHKDLEEKMFTTTATYDQKLISLFNKKQYERYLLLCDKANRTAILKLE